MKQLSFPTVSRLSQQPIRLLASLIAHLLGTGLLLQGSILPALAGYVPPDGGSAPRAGSTTPNTVRGGCRSSSVPGLTALAPQSHVGQTGSTQPTFVWFASETTAFPVEFRMFEYQSDGNLQEIFETELNPTSQANAPGMMAFSLRETALELSPGSTYRWQVVMICDPNRPSTALVAEADIEVVSLPEDLKLRLSATDDAPERANLYANAGVWYDAIAEVLSASPEHDTGRSLLSDLAELEAQPNSTPVELTYSYQLRQIIEQVW